MPQLIRPQGSWVAIVTPFNAQMELDLGVMRDLVDFQAANGTSTLLITGSTGEPTLLTLEERKRIIKDMAAYCKGKIHAFFGVSSGSTAMTIELARYAQEQDADGIVLVVPPYVCPSQEGVYEFLYDVASAVDISVGIYNNPARVVANIDPETIVRLFNAVPNLVADKEAMPSVGQLAAVHEGTQGRLHILCCDSPVYGLTLPTLALGGKGTANVTGNVHPRAMAEMSKPWASFADVETSRRIYYEILPLMEAVYAGTNPVGTKAMVRLLGFPVGSCRKPLKEPSPVVLEAMREIIERYELKKMYGLC